MQRVIVTLHGRVQGVGLRYAVNEFAHRYRLRGWVRNELDGTVKIVVEGHTADVDEFLRWVRRPGIGNVERSDVDWGNAANEFADFSIR